MTNEIKRDTQIGWIYEGAKALVNREDYLLGKRVRVYLIFNSFFSVV